MVPCLVLRDVATRTHQSTQPHRPIRQTNIRCSIFTPKHCGIIGFNQSIRCAWPCYAAGVAVKLHELSLLTLDTSPSIGAPSWQRGLTLLAASSTKLQGHKLRAMHLDVGPGSTIRPPSAMGKGLDTGRDAVIRRKCCQLYSGVVSIPADRTATTCDTLHLTFTRILKQTATLPEA